MELCESLDVGGLTPRHDLVAAVRESSRLPLCVLVRSRPDFLATPAELDSLMADVARFAATGVDGIVIGVLDSRGEIDGAALGDIVAEARGVPVVFHRAFDVLADPLSGLERLVDAGVARVLTSGGAARAWDGRATLRKLVDLASGRLTILAGGGVRAKHVHALVREAGVSEIHARASAVPDIMTALRRGGHQD